MTDKRTTTRKVLFYKLDCGKTNGSYDPFPVDQFLKEIKKLGDDPNTKGRLFVEWDEISGITCQYLGKNRLMIGKARTADFPLKFRTKQLIESDFDPDDVLLEPSHWMFFPDNIVGVEYNHYGARKSSAIYYLNELLDELGLPKIDLYNFTRKNPYDQIKEMDEISMMEIAFRHVDPNLEIDENLLNAMHNLQEMGKEEGIVFSITIKRRGGVGQKLSKIFSKDLKKLIGCSEKAKINGRSANTGKSTGTRNLLESIISSNVTVVELDNRKAVDPFDMFRKIQEAYTNALPDIQNGIILDLESKSN
jgi:hypothetical protein